MFSILAVIFSFICIVLRRRDTKESTSVFDKMLPADDNGFVCTHFSIIFESVGYMEIGM